MAGFDEGGVFYSDSFFFDQGDGDVQKTDLQQAKKRFKDFIKQFQEENYVYIYRDQLKQHYNMKQYWLEIALEDLTDFDELLGEKLNKQPAEYLPLFEEAAKEVADEITRPRPEGEEEIQDIQITLRSNANPCLLRELKSDHISKLVKVPGIIIAASNVQAKATCISIQCRSCKEIVPKIKIKPGLDGYNLPRRCNTDQTTGQTRCPVDPYFIVPDKCECVDYQILKMQESPDYVPHGEMPRHLMLYCDRNLCERVVPGNRVTVLGIYSIKKVSRSKKGQSEKANVGIRNPYIRVVGISVVTEGAGRSTGITFTSEEEETFRFLASSPNILDRITKSIAPSIYGSVDIKKAVACMLFGGSRKRMPDGLTRRGDINILLLGDPGTAKSQLLKFVEKVAPVGVYTSGKGSSAAGLTASVIRDPHSRNFIMEGGAMVLADGGVVCIDEFDKMREDDRVAIHEAMEQQTISIAKAGITTTLNSRCAVFAAANSVFGRWDESKAEANIDFMPTILSRFDMIFIVKDDHDEKKDSTLAKHVMALHMNALQATEEVEGELSLSTLKKYIAYCRMRCGPRLSNEAADKLKNYYLFMRSSSKEHQGMEKKSNIPITVRQLEAIVRISEALAKMELQPFATERHVDEAMRLFQVSTLDAAHSGDLAGAEGFTTEEEHQMLLRIEKQLKKRFAIGSQVSEFSIVQDFLKQKYPERAIYKVLYLMIRRGELQHRMQRKMLYRIK
ncbi:DNA replication licensing factor mcm5-A isoform X2 [Parasteatoda tepidariorum]|uniref:DNA replication licensing factor MCM5 n=1 Tax=Parasteatoda tepidariorum TaxID=114398 RepID=A0A2L2YJJ0_PARTP|nr:DNA replication licensing factor mcm5-A [Parasteatoda tepidariorum]